MASVNLTILLLTLPLLYILNRVYSIGRQYVAVRHTKLPILVNPVSITSLEWTFGKKYLRAIFQRLPPYFSAWTKRIEDWNQGVKFGQHEALRTHAYWIVDNQGRELYLADPAAAEDVLRRCRGEFVKNPETYTLLDIFGLNVVTANGRTWERHRRVTVPPFNERVSETVWDESGRQGAGARAKWMAASAAPGGVVRSTQEDTTRIAFNVLSAAGYGVTFDFADVEGQSGLAEADRAAGHRMSYRDSLFLLLDDFIPLVIYRVGLRFGWPVAAMWGRVKEIAVAQEEYAWYMRDMLKNEREKIRRGENLAEKARVGEKENLMSVLIRNSEQGPEGEASNTEKSGPVLSDDEVYGNLFIYNLAGHDTTAGALNYAVALLAARPKWQEWLAEEIDTVVREDQSSLRYATVFPKLHRCLALMYEVLRMFGPVTVAPRWTANSWQKITIDGKELAIPPDTTIKLDLVALHHDPKYWGPDALDFRPDRWIPKASSQENNAKDSPPAAGERSYDWQSKSLVSPTPGSFLPWTGGPRVCPGKKFSQVEFTRAVLEMFKGNARVRVVQEEGESQEQAEARAWEILNQTRAAFVIKMGGSERLGVRWFVKGD